MFIREKLAWCLLTLAAALGAGAECGRERTAGDLADVRAELAQLKERVQEHNDRAFEKTFELYQGKGEK